MRCVTLLERDPDEPFTDTVRKVAGFSRSLEKTETINESRRQKRKRGIWQRR